MWKKLKIKAMIRSTKVCNSVVNCGHHEMRRVSKRPEIITFGLVMVRVAIAKMRNESGGYLQTVFAYRALSSWNCYQ
jgi:hypothetical protein